MVSRILILLLCQILVVQSAGADVRETLIEFKALSRDQKAEYYAMAMKVFHPQDAKLFKDHEQTLLSLLESATFEKGKIVIKLEGELYKLSEFDRKTKTVKLNGVPLDLKKPLSEVAEEYARMTKKQFSVFDLVVNRAHAAIETIALIFAASALLVALDYFLDNLKAQKKTPPEAQVDENARSVKEVLTTPAHGNSQPVPGATPE